MAHRHILGFIIAFVGIIFVVVGAQSFEHTVIKATQDSLVVRIFDQEFNGPLVFLGIILIAIGIGFRLKDKHDCKKCNSKRK